MPRASRQLIHFQSGQILFWNSIEESSHKVRQGRNVSDFKMKNLYPRLIFSLVCVFTIAQPLPAQTPEAKPKQFIYVLRLPPRRSSSDALTDREKHARCHQSAHV